MATDQTAGEDDHIAKAIAWYLNDHGYHAAAAKLIEEESFRRLGTTPSSVNGSLKRPRVEELRKGSDFYTSYNELQNWILDSLDQFRDELWPVSWVVYVHFFICLIEEQKYDFAVKFRDAFREKHRHAHEEEISELSCISTSIDLAKSNFVRRYKENTFQITMCKKLMSVLLTINSKIQFKETEQLVPIPAPSYVIKSSSLPQEVIESISGSRIISGCSRDRLAGINSKNVFWSVPYELQSLYDELRVRYSATGDSEKKPRAKELSKDKQNLEFCPPTDNEFFTNLCKYVVEPLRFGTASLEEEENFPNEKYKEEKFSNHAQIGDHLAHSTHIGEAIPAWPSIAFHTFLNSHGSLTCVDSSVDSTVVVGGFDDSKIKLWQNFEHGLGSFAEKALSLLDSYDGNLTDHKKRRREKHASFHTEDLVGHSGPVYACSLNRDSRSLLSCSGDGLIKLWLYLPMQKIEKTNESALWSNIANFRPRSYATPCPIWDVRFSPVGYYFASASHENVVRLWSIECTSDLRTFEGHISDVDTVAWHPNCHYIASGSTDKTVRLWDINSGGCARIFAGHTSGVSSLTFDPSGRYLISAESNGLIFVWDLVAGKRTHILQGHDNTVWSLSCSPDGHYLASGGSDATIRVWNTNYIWGKAQKQVKCARKLEDKTQQLHNVVRTFRTKYTDVSFVRFQNERFLLGCGAFSLPLMK